MTNGWLGVLGAAGLLAALGLVFVAVPAPPPAGGAPAAPRLAALASPAQVPMPAARPPVAPPRRVPAALAPAAPAELDRVVAAARLGDRRAGYAAYRLLSPCAEAACPGVPLTLVNERLRFLAEAARAGVAGAQVDFFLEGPDAVQAADGEGLQAWREQALGGLKDAAAQCEPFAMGQLATLLDAGELTPRDAIAAVAYAVAEGQLRHRPPSDESLRDRLGEPIADADLEAARVRGLGLVAACR
ncbi:hypothetical protein [Roseateles sp. BYS96W]|uniref:Uncharacterized protein n=1 Tax=Pelomonas nitida TaxID=3299027 RepID=A0ABW7G885_9BURK